MNVLTGCASGLILRRPIVALKHQSRGLVYRTSHRPEVERRLQYLCNRIVRSTGGQRELRKPFAEIVLPQGCFDIETPLCAHPEANPKRVTTRHLRILAHWCSYQQMHQALINPAPTRGSHRRRRRRGHRAELTEPGIAGTLRFLRNLLGSLSPVFPMA